MKVSTTEQQNNREIWEGNKLVQESRGVRLAPFKQVTENRYKSGAERESSASVEYNNELFMYGMVLTLASPAQGVTITQSHQRRPCRT